MAGSGSIVNLVVIVVIGVIAIKFGPQLIDQLQTAIQNAGAGGAAGQDANGQDQQNNDQQVNDPQQITDLTNAINNLQQQVNNQRQQPVIINNQRRRQQQQRQPRIKVKNRNFGCQCKGRQCCFNGLRCNGQPARDCTTARSNNVRDKNNACQGVRQRFLNRNPCASNAGIAFGDKGQIVSLDSLSVTLA